MLDLDSGTQRGSEWCPDFSARFRCRLFVFIPLVKFKGLLSRSSEIL